MIGKQFSATAVSLSNDPFCVTVTPRAQTDPVPERRHFRVFPSQKSLRSRHNLTHTHTLYRYFKITTTAVFFRKRPIFENGK